LFAGGAGLLLAGCARDDGPTAAKAPLGTGRRGSGPVSSESLRAPVATARVEADPSFRALEVEYGARLGVWARNTATGSHVEHRADERFAFCSTCKAFSAAAVLHERSISDLNTVVRYTAADLVQPSPITSQRVASGMTIRELCDAAVRYSDNTAANLLLAQIGGPAGLQTYLRSLGDTVTNSSRLEPKLNSAVPGDERDTTTPRAWGVDLQTVVLGDALPTDKRAVLTDWLVRNTTGNTLIRAAAPAGWPVADKTGSGDYGTRNDIAVLWPPEDGPLVVVVMSTRTNQDDPLDDTLVAKAASAALTSVRRR
jgi:beta-lactamase class A